MNTIANDFGYDPILFSQTDSLKVRNKRVAEEVESLFVSQLLKEMDKTINREESDFFYSRGEEVFRSVFHQEVAREISRGEGIGLKDAILSDIEQQQAQLGVLPGAAQ